MGCYNCKKKNYQNINYLAPEEKEIQIKDYSSPNDEQLEIVETKINFFHFIQLVEYVNLLEQFSIETSKVIADDPMRTTFSSKDTFLEQNLTIEEFQSFIEDKIFNLEDLYDITANNQQLSKLFKQICIEIYKALQKQLGENFEDKHYILKKKDLLTLGILFCSCENIEKIKLLFDFFKNEEELFRQSNGLNNFLLSLFLVGSYCLINARNKINNDKLGILKLESKDYSQFTSYFDLKNCQKLVQVFNEDFFQKEKYNWNEFKKKFEDMENGFGWLISSKGIRRKLEEKNL